MAHDSISKALRGLALSMSMYRCIHRIQRDQPYRTDNYCVHGLWAVDYHDIIDFMGNYSLNGLRLPFSVDLVLSNPAPVSINFYQMNADLKGLSSLEVMDKIIEACADKGIVVMLDMHSLESGGYMQDGLWYDSKYPQDTTLKAWNMMVERYKDQWNVVAADVFNEPFDGTWGQGDTSTDFNTWCETVGNDMHSNGVSWLIMCEGVANNPPCTDACFWGIRVFYNLYHLRLYTNVSI